MGMFNTLMSKIFGGAPSPAPAAATAPTAAPAAGAPGTVIPAPAAAASTPAVDVGAVLDGLAAKNSEKLDWKHSIVDLMKLVGMDSSLTARKELAKDLNYTGDTNDSATMNMWLHQQVLKKLAENGGKIPAGLIH